MNRHISFRIPFLFRKAIFYSGIALGISLATPNAAQAAVITPLDHWTDQWKSVKSGGATIIEMQGDTLVISRPAPPPGGSVSSTGGIAFWEGSDTVSGQLSNFSGSVILNSEGRVNDAWGVVVGAQSTTFTGSEATNYRGYYIAFVPGDGGEGHNAGLNIWYNHTTGDRPTDGDALVHDQTPGAVFPNEVDFLLELSVTGATINASLWNVDDDGVKTGSVLASVTYTAEDPVVGYFGLKAYRLGNTASRSFSDLKLEVIPEPGSVALACSAALGCFAYRCFASRRSRR